MKDHAKNGDDFRRSGEKKSQQIRELKALVNDMEAELRQRDKAFMERERGSWTRLRPE